MRILVSIALLTALLLGQAPAPSGPSSPPASKKPVPEEAAPGYQSINPEDCKKWLSALASDEFEGRETGTPGYQKAADMVAAQFKEFGLVPVGDKDAEGLPTFFQNVPFVAAGINPETAHFEVTGGKDADRAQVRRGIRGDRRRQSQRSRPARFRAREEQAAEAPRVRREGQGRRRARVRRRGQPGAALELGDRRHQEDRPRGARPRQRRRRGARDEPRRRDEEGPVRAERSRLARRERPPS